MNKLFLVPGAEVYYQDRPAIIESVLSLSLVRIRFKGNRDIETVSIAHLTAKPSSHNTPKSIATFGDISEEEWQTGVERYRLITPLLCDGRSVAMVEACARSAGLHRSTIYRLLSRYEGTGTSSSLIKFKPNGGRGKTRLPNTVENELVKIIKDEYLTEQKVSPEMVVETVKRIFSRQGVKTPSPNTVRNRILRRGERETMEKREGKKKARNKFDPIKGSFPGADHPLAVVQIDHTPVDCIVVDDTYRLPLCRPWITIAFDVYDSMPLGFYLSLDPPGTIGTALCLAHAIMPKETWLAERGIEGHWPAWGIMKKIHLDNAKEFRGKALTRGCEEFGIDIEWRPVATPHYGGHIERYMKTLSTFLKRIPGTTFSNVEEKGDYASEGKAVLTLAELEKVIARYVVGIYIQKMHSRLNMSPLQKREQGFLGDSIRPGIGLPPREIDVRRIRLAFMPMEERTVQRDGIVLGHIHYQSNVLRNWIGARNPENPRKGRQFVIRRDPRDISKIYFLDPEVNEYFEVPYRNINHPPISIWEYNAIRKKQREEGIKGVNEEMIFRSAEKNIAEIEEASQKTKRVRKGKQRRSDHAKAHDGLEDRVKPDSADEPVSYEYADITPYEDDDE